MVRRGLRADHVATSICHLAGSIARENLQDNALAEALQAICDFDLTELQAIIPRAASVGTDTEQPLAEISFLRRVERGPFCAPIGGPFWMPIDKRPRATSGSAWIRVKTVYRSGPIRRSKRRAVSN